MARSTSFLPPRVPRLLPIATSLIILALISHAVYSYLLQPVNSTITDKVEFQIQPGQGIDRIASSLQSQKLIRSKEALKFYLVTHRLNSKVQAGYFYLSPSQSTPDIAVSLTRAVTKQLWVTIPEGLRRQEIANLILDTLEESETEHRFDPDAFVRQTSSLEGRLYPDTYELSPQVTTEEVISILTDQFDRVISSIKINPQQLPRILTLASLIEREAGADSERPEIAGILTNRLNNNWPLQVDATVQYALSTNRCRIRVCDWWPRPLTRADLQVDSPYNTYLNPGLPPGPISNPGRASLEAAAAPRTTDNWFYLHDPSGVVHYASTVEEHNRNVCQYLKKDCS